MSLFKRKPVVEGGPVGVPGLPELAAAWDMRPVEGRVFDGHLEDKVHEVTRVLYRQTRSRTTFTHETVGATTFSDSYSGTVGGHPVTVTNAWTEMEYDPRHYLNYSGTAVCAVELPTMLTVAGIAPRPYAAAVPGPELSTGNSSFDEGFRVAGATGSELITPPVQQAVMVHDDWVFVAERYLLGCISVPAFRSSDEVAQRIKDVLAVVNAFPSDLVPDHVDHSFDDLLARIGGLKTVDEALVFLHELTPEDRDRLARSDTPLAAFADVHDPAEAMARLNSLDEAQKLQVLAMFMKVKDQKGR
jgi:hypothetical protein